MVLLYIIYQIKLRRIILTWMLIIMGGQQQLILPQILFVVAHSESNTTMGGTTGIRNKSKDLHRYTKNNDAPTLGTAKNAPTLFVNEPWSSSCVDRLLLRT